MTLGNARRKFWERVFVAVLPSAMPARPDSAGVIAYVSAFADEALAAWEKQWTREEPPAEKETDAAAADRTVPCEECCARLDLAGDYGEAGHGWEMSPDGEWTCPKCASKRTCCDCRRAIEAKEGAVWSHYLGNDVDAWRCPSCAAAHATTFGGGA